MAEAFAPRSCAKSMCSSLSARLGDGCGHLADPIEIQATASRILGQHLGANRVAYFELRGTDYVIERDYTHGSSTLVGRYPVASFGQKILQEYRSGRVAIGDDVAADATLTASEQAAYAAAQVGAYIGVPLIKNGEFVVGLGVMCAPRNGQLRNPARDETPSAPGLPSRARAEERWSDPPKYRTLSPTR